VLSFTDQQLVESLAELKEIIKLDPILDTLVVEVLLQVRNFYFSIKIINPFIIFAYYDLHNCSFSNANL
jgi:hypothetical protein